MVPVPEAEPIVGQHRIRNDLSAGWGVPAHITVLYPWMPPADIDNPAHIRLAELFASFARFDFALGEIGWFRKDVLYATPVPDTSFRALTERVLRTWPQFPPYGGEHGEPTPHLTIGDHGTEAALTDAGIAVERHLPMACVAREVWLMTGSAASGWTRRSVYPLGTA